MELTPSRTAVIAVHMQHDIISADGGFGGFFAAQAAERDVIGQAGQAARRRPPVRRRRRLHPRRLAARATRTWSSTRRCWAWSRSSAHWSRAAPRPRSSRSSPRRTATSSSTHQRVGGFSASQLDVILRSRGVDTVLFAGVATNASVESTARQASDLGYRTIIVADACSAADPGAHDAAVASLGLLGRDHDHGRGRRRAVRRGGERMTAATATPDTPVWVALSSTPHAISYVQVGPWRTRVLQAGPSRARRWC